LTESSSHVFQVQWVDFRRLPRPPRALGDKIATATKLYPCDLLFVHRDANGSPHEERVLQIRRELAAASSATAVCVVPVRATETWLLFNEEALRSVAGNPKGRVHLDVPPLLSLENLPNPKETLHGLLRIASGLPRRRRFSLHERIHRLADLIDDFSPLRKLAAFRALEAELRSALAEKSWQ
jgi:hypothetical protein